MVYFSYFKIYKKYAGSSVYLVMFLSLLTVILDSIGIVMLMPIIGDQSSDSFVRNAIAALLGIFGLSPNYTALLTIILVLFLIKGGVSFLVNASLVQIRGNLFEKFKLSILGGVVAADFQYVSSKGSGYFTNLINDQVVKSIQSFYAFMKCTANCVSAAIYIVVAFSIAPIFGLLASASAILVIFMFRVLNRFIRSISRLRAKEAANLSSKLIDFFQNIQYLRGTNADRIFLNRITTLISYMRSLEIKNGLSIAVLQSIREPIGVVFIVSITLVNIYFFDAQIASLLVSMLLFYRSLNSFFAVQSFWQSSMESVGSLEAIDNELTQLQRHEVVAEKKDDVKFDNFLEFEQVSFGYEGSRKLAVSNLNFTIKKGQKVGFVGQSGAGKTTIIDLITGLLSPTEGTVKIDGESLTASNARSWRNIIGYVPQDPAIFQGSIEENISFFENHNHKKNVLLQTSAKEANIYDFIAALPEGFDTLTGDRGTKLSGGQRQRICIAREFYRRPKLFILDEATSSLDTTSEAHVQSSVDALQSDVTVIVVAHRLSTIRNMDVIHVLEGGNIVEAGSYENLANDANSKFNELLHAGQTFSKS